MVRRAFDHIAVHTQPLLHGTFQTLLPPRSVSAQCALCRYCHPAPSCIIEYSPHRRGESSTTARQTSPSAEPRPSTEKSTIPLFHSWPKSNAKKRFPQGCMKSSPALSRQHVDSKTAPQNALVRLIDIAPTRAAPVAVSLAANPAGNLDLSHLYWLPSCRLCVHSLSEQGAWVEARSER